MQLRGRQSFVFSNSPSICSWASAVGKKEGEGPLSGTFDLVLQDDMAGEASWEKAESMLQKHALELALKKGKLQPDELNLISGGDLLNQCVGTS